MRTKLWQTNWRDAVAGLGAAGHLPDAEGVALTKAYDFLRRCESVCADTKIQAPGLPATLRSSCYWRARGAATLDDFRHEYNEARTHS